MGVALAERESDHRSSGLRPDPPTPEVRVERPTDFVFEELDSPAMESAAADDAPRLSFDDGELEVPGIRFPGERGSACQERPCLVLRIGTPGLKADDPGIARIAVNGCEVRLVEGAQKQARRLERGPQCFTQVMFASAIGGLCTASRATFIATLPAMSRNACAEADSG